VIPHKANANRSRLFLPVSLGQEFQPARGRSANPKRSTTPKILALLARNGHAGSIAQCPHLGGKAENIRSR
jgi:hypothetical protein